MYSSLFYGIDRDGFYPISIGYAASIFRWLTWYAWIRPKKACLLYTSDAADE